MALANCITQVLCGLSAATRAALTALIKSYVTQLEVYKAGLTLKIAELDILSAGPQVLNALVQTAISEAKAGANIVPLDFLGSCFEFNELNETIQANVDLVLVKANVIANDLSRLLSFRNELDALLNATQAKIDYYTAVIATIDACNTVGLT